MQVQLLAVDVENDKYTDVKNDGSSPRSTILPDVQLIHLIRTLFDKSGHYRYHYHYYCHHYYYYYYYCYHRRRSS